MKNSLENWGSSMKTHKFVSFLIIILIGFFLIIDDGLIGLGNSTLRGTYTYYQKTDTGYDCQTLTFDEGLVTFNKGVNSNNIDTDNYSISNGRLILYGDKDQVDGTFVLSSDKKSFTSEISRPKTFNKISD